MKQILIFIVLVFFSFNHGYSDDWKVKNKWKISCGVVDKEALIVNGKPKKYSKKEFKLIDVVFKLDKGDIGSCPTDKKPAGGFPYSGRQEITHKLPIGHSIFETDLLVEGAPSKRTTIFQIHDGRNSGAPPSWIGLDGGWKIIHKFPKGQCSQQNCRMHKFISLDTGKTYKFKAEIDYQKKSKFLSVKYFLDDEFILQHYDVPLSVKKTDGPYGPSKPYMKIGIYRIGETGTTTYYYKNLIVKSKKKSTFEKTSNKAKGIPKFFAIVTRKSDSTVQFRVEDKDKGRARVQAMKKCFDQKYDDCTVALEGITD
tara:strand:- start:230 stop:1165 length:936 start_codon:yes stop_codon:yes gene_type:complete